MNVTKSLQAHRHLQLVAHCWHWRPAETWAGTGTSDCSTSGTATYSAAAQTDTMVNKYFGWLDVATTIVLDQGILLSELYGTSKASNSGIRSHLRASRSWSTSRVFPGMLYHASHATTIRLGGNPHKGRFHNQTRDMLEWTQTMHRVLNPTCITEKFRLCSHTRVSGRSAPVGFDTQCLGRYHVCDIIQANCMLKQCWMTAASVNRLQFSALFQHEERVRGVSWSEVATVPKRKSHRGLDLDLSLNSEVNIRKGWKENDGTK